MAQKRQTFKPPVLAALPLRQCGLSLTRVFLGTLGRRARKTGAFNRSAQGSQKNSRQRQTAQA